MNKIKFDDTLDTWWTLEHQIGDVIVFFKVFSKKIDNTRFFRMSFKIYKKGDSHVFFYIIANILMTDFCWMILINFNIM